MVNLRLSTIQDEIVKELKIDNDFIALSNAHTSQELNFYIDTDVELGNEEIPFFNILKLPKKDSITQNPEWALQFIIGISAEGKKPTLVDGVTRYLAPEKAEELAESALIAIEKRVGRGFYNGVKNICLNLDEIITVVAEVGETDDQLVYVTMVFSSDRTLG